jgi:hypothetical protein
MELPFLADSSSSPPVGVRLLLLPLLGSVPCFFLSSVPTQASSGTKLLRMGQTGMAGRANAEAVKFSLFMTRLTFGHI